MKLSNGDKAIVDVVKLEWYCLNFDHPKAKQRASLCIRAKNISV